jgi:hypothetical protein
MRFPLAVSAAAIVAIAVAACTGSSPPNYIPPPTGSVPSTGAVTLGAATTTSSAGTAGAVTAILTFVGGSGTVTAASSATAPTGTTAVTPADRIRVEASTSPTSPNVYYVTITSAAGATLTGLPGVNLALSTPSVGTFQEAQFGNGKWANVGVSASNAGGAGSTGVSFPQGSTAIAIPAGGSIFLAFYQGTFPAPTPPGQIQNTAVADPSFEGTAAAFGSPVTAKGWTVCTITTTASGASLLPSRPFPKFTPVPNTTPQASILANGASVPQGTGTPTPTQNTVPVNSGKQAAVLGGVFSNFNDSNFAYNGLCQMVKIPANPVGSLSVFANGTENSLAFYGFQVNVLDTTGAYLTNLVDENQIAVKPPGDTAYRLVVLPSSSLAPFAGQTVELFVGFWTKAGTSTGSTTFSAYYFVDDVGIAGS